MPTRHRYNAFSNNRTVVNGRLISIQQLYTPRGIRADGTWTTNESAVFNADFDVYSNAEVSIQSANNQNIVLTTTGTGKVEIPGKVDAGLVFQKHYNNTSSLLVPTGSVSAYAGSSAPGGWLLCDGTAVSRTDYATLFAIIDITYGNGDGVNTFNLPNLKGRVVVGRDAAQTEFDGLGETGGAKTHTLTINEMPSHTHTYLGVVGQGNFGGGADTSADEANRPTETSGATGGGQAHNNLQPYLVLNYIIKL
jgi:microcystin-dependent protein